MFHICLCYAVLSVRCNIVITYWERADFLALLCVMFSCIFGCLGSGMVLDCIDYWYLPLRPSLNQFVSLTLVVCDFKHFLLFHHSHLIDLILLL